jgi:hypothetical protein
MMGIKLVIIIFVGILILDWLLIRSWYIKFQIKLKDRNNCIDILQKSCDIKDNRLKRYEIEVAMLTWKLNNPAKYKVGDDQFGEHIITGADLHKPDFKKMVIHFGVFFLTGIITKEIKAMFPPNQLKYEWEYELLNKTTGKKILVLESDMEKDFSNNEPIN